MPVLLSSQTRGPSETVAREPDPASQAIAARLLADEPALDIRRQSLLDRCSSPWTFLVVDTDGAARPCVWAGLAYGNLAHQEWEEVWNGENAQRLRRQFLAGEAPAECVDRPCRVFE
jgi:MoaA/NifB/PqqE/SkfB family radical SAM enzyme